MDDKSGGSEIGCALRTSMGAIIGKRTNRRILIGRRDPIQAAFLCVHSDSFGAPNLGGAIAPAFRLVAALGSDHARF